MRGDHLATTFRSFIIPVQTAHSSLRLIPFTDAPPEPQFLAPALLKSRVARTFSKSSLSHTASTFFANEAASPLERGTDCPSHWLSSLKEDRRLAFRGSREDSQKSRTCAVRTGGITVPYQPNVGRCQLNVGVSNITDKRCRTAAE